MNNDTSAQTDSAVLDSLLRETVALSTATRDYLQAERPRAENHLDELLWVQETTRLSARLTHAVAWLLGRKAVHHGEISAAEAQDEKWRLGGHHVCATECREIARLPSRLVALLHESQLLYSRLARLDAQLAGETPPVEPTKGGGLTLVSSNIH